MRIFLTYLLIFSLGTTLLFGQQNESDLIRNVDNLLLNSRFQEAIDLISSAAGPAPSPLVENKKAESLTRLGNLDEAEKLLKKIEASLAAEPRSFHRAVTASNTGYLQLNQGRNDLAEASLQRALQLFEETATTESAEAAQAFANLGLVYMSQGKYSQAQEHLHRALSVREQLRNAEELVAATYNDLGLVYSQTDKDKALDYFEQAQKMYTRLYGARHAKIAIASINTGILYRDLELYGDAVNYFETALEISNAVYSQPHPAKAIALYNLGQTYLQLKDQKAAMAYYEQARKMYENVYGPHHPELASVLNAIGNLHLANSDFEEALQTYQGALHANVPDFKDSDLKSNPPLKNYYHGTRLLHSLLFKAQAFESRYFGKTLKFSDLREALNVLTRCDSLIDQLRQHSTNENDKLLLGVLANEAYTDGVRIAYEAGMNALQKDGWFRKAFYFAEKSKGAVLLESISEANAKSFAGIPDHLLEEEKNIKSALTLTARKLAQKPSPDEEKILRENSFALKRRYDAFGKKLEKEFPAYFNLKFNSATPSIAQLQQMLDDKTALLSYFIDEKNNQLYIFNISDDRFKVLQRPWPKDADKFMTGLRNGLYFNEIGTFKRSAYTLGQALIPELRASIKELVILPVGRLGLLPFETLLTADPEKITDYRSMPFLLNRYSIRYEFSAGLILQRSSRETGLAAPSIFLCAPVRFTARDILADLPGTEREVREISRLFSDKNLSADAYTHVQAGELRIKTAALKNYDFIHFATHGIVDETNPELSRIFLQPDDDREDGNLFAGEIYNLELDADLVTLSACQTGMGKIQRGEGVIGLSRALVYAGAKNILVSFWNVADESTTVFMKDFYGNILQDKASDYGHGLREAKLKMLQSEQYSAPFYWAPFVLIGF